MGEAALDSRQKAWVVFPPPGAPIPQTHPTMGRGARPAEEQSALGGPPYGPHGDDAVGRAQPAHQHSVCVLAPRRLRTHTHRPKHPVRGRANKLAALPARSDHRAEGGTGGSRDGRGGVACPVCFIPWMTRTARHTHASCSRRVCGGPNAACVTCCRPSTRRPGLAAAAGPAAAGRAGLTRPPQRACRATSLALAQVRNVWGPVGG